VSSLNWITKSLSIFLLFLSISPAPIGKLQLIPFPREQITAQTINRIALLNSFPISEDDHAEIQAVRFNRSMDIVYVGDTTGTFSSWAIPQGTRYQYSFTANEFGIDPVDSIAVSPNDDYVAVAYSSGTINVFDLQILPIHNTLLLRPADPLPFGSPPVEFSPSSILAFGLPYLDDWVGRTRSYVRLWNIDDMTIISLPLTQPVQALAFSSDSRLLAIGYGHQIQLWDMVTDQNIASIDLRNDTGEWNVVSLAFSPDGNMLAAGSIGIYASTNSYAFVWQVSDLIQNSTSSSPENAIYRLWHEDSVNDVDFSVDSTLLVSASGSGTIGGIRIWAVSTNPGISQEPLLMLAEGDMYSLDVSEWYIAAGGRDGLVRIWGIVNPGE
jgi:WD40 repeat protein